MVDTVRDRPALLTLLADNVTEDISPQDVRDAIVSIYGVIAAIYVADGAVAQAGVDGTPVLMTGFAANGASIDATPDHTADSITINTDGTYLCIFQCSFSGDNNITFEFHFRVDGVEQIYGGHRKLNANGDEASVMAIGPLVLTATDVVTIYVESNAGGGASFTPIDASMTVLKTA